MLDYLMRQLSRTLGVWFRTARAFFSRMTTGLVSRFRRLTNFSRGAASAASSTLESAVSAAQAPTRREDYIEVGALLISKALLIRALLTLAGLILIAYFVVWPFVLSHFLTARFFVEDSRVENWTGRVIVYADWKKTLPIYGGRTEDGVLQGTGREYDGEGRLSYEGQFLDGLRSGAGTAYVRGVLRYEGQFADGLYEGSGTLYGDEGERLYEGQFVRGVYEGTGTLYENGLIGYEGQFSGGEKNGRGRQYADGLLTYEGDFLNGVFSGQGTLFYTDGTPAYRGGFLDGVKDGTGRAWEESGRLVYEGGFGDGLYNGTGSLYPVEGHRLDAEFQDGEPVGTVRWSRDGKIYYEGDWTEKRPSGYGKLYDEGGTLLYQGRFAGGTIDGSWLLTLSADDLRETLNRTREQDSFYEGGYLITCPAMGLAVRCSYRTETDESNVRVAELVQPDDGGWIRLLPGMDGIALPEAGGARAVSVEQYRPPVGSPLAPRFYGALHLVFPDWWAVSLTRSGETVLVRWYHTSDAPPALAALAGINGGAGADVRDADFLYGGDGTAGGGPSAGTDGGPSAGTGGGTGNSVAGETASGTAGGLSGTSGGGTGGVALFLNLLDETGDTGSVALSAGAPLYGEGSVADALAKCETAADAVELADALFAWYIEAEREAALTENLSRTESLLLDARTAYARGTGSRDAVTAVEEQGTDLRGEMELCQAERKKAELRAQVFGAAPAELALNELLLFFDPAGLDADRTVLTAIAYAQATGRAGDTAVLEKDAKTALVNLEEAYSRCMTALERYGEAVQGAQDAAKAYGMGSGSKAAWSAALSASADARSALSAAAAGFGQAANNLNRLTGGYVSRAYQWYEAAFVPLFEADMVEPEPPELPETEPVPVPEPASDGAGQAEEVPGSAGAGQTDAPGSAGQSDEAAPPSDGAEPAEEAVPASDGTGGTEESVSKSDGALPDSAGAPPASDGTGGEAAEEEADPWLPPEFQRWWERIAEAAS